VVDEAEDPVGQRQHALRGEGHHEVRQAALHLGRGLEWGGWGGDEERGRVGRKRE
jgi:hypothetical protein